MAEVFDTPDHDPRHDRAQTIEGAKERYADHENGYVIEDFEADVARILEDGEYPDADATYQGTPVPPTDNDPNRNVDAEPLLEGQRI